MIRSLDPFGRWLPSLLTVLLTVPLAVSVHHHDADHEGDVAHLELPHGGHDSPAPELYERVPSAGPEPLAPPLASQAPGSGDVPASRPRHPESRFLDHPARPPPPPRLARGPPSLSP